MIGQQLMIQSQVQGSSLKGEDVGMFGEEESGDRDKNQSAKQAFFSKINSISNQFLNYMEFVNIYTPSDIQRIISNKDYHHPHQQHSSIHSFPQNHHNKIFNGSIAAPRGQKSILTKGYDFEDAKKEKGEDDNNDRSERSSQSDDDGMQAGYILNYDKGDEELNEKLERARTLKQKEKLIRDFQQLPFKSLYGDTKVVKKYQETYQKSYNQRRKKFGYTRSQIKQIQEMEVRRKQKNCWMEFKRWICCRGGNELDEVEELNKNTENDDSNFSVTTDAMTPAVSDAMGEQILDQNDIVGYKGAKPVKKDIKLIEQERGIDLAEGHNLGSEMFRNPSSLTAQNSKIKKMNKRAKRKALINLERIQDGDDVISDLDNKQTDEFIFTESGTASPELRPSADKPSKTNNPVSPTLMRVHPRPQSQQDEMQQIDINNYQGKQTTEDEKAEQKRIQNEINYEVAATHLPGRIKRSKKASRVAREAVLMQDESLPSEKMSAGQSQQNANNQLTEGLDEVKRTKSTPHSTSLPIQKPDNQKETRPQAFEQSALEGMNAAEQKPLPVSTKRKRNKVKDIDEQLAADPQVHDLSGGGINLASIDEEDIEELEEENEDQKQRQQEMKQSTDSNLIKSKANKKRRRRQIVRQLAEAEYDDQVIELWEQTQ